MYHSVIVSHNHHDHLNSKSVKDLYKKFGQKISWFVPKGVKKWFKSCITENNVYEFDWWQFIKIHNFEIVFTPAQHWSGRGLFDKFEVLFYSFVKFIDI